MGVHVVLTGQACRWLEHQGGPSGLRARGDGWSWEALLRRVAPHVSRLDVALDDRTGGVTPERAEAALESGSVVKRWRTWEPRRRRGGAKREGLTVYLGDRSSAMFARIYDKAAQEGVSGPWCRVEVEAKGQRARALAGHLGGRGVAAVTGILRGYLDFKDRADEWNLRRRPTAAWWATFLQGASEQRLAMAPALPRTVEAALAHVERQWGPWLGVIECAYGWEAIRAAAARSVDRWGPGHRAAALAAAA